MTQRTAPTVAGRMSQTRRGGARALAALTATLLGLACGPPLDEQCRAVFNRLCDECPRNVGVFVDPQPTSAAECKALVDEACREFAGRRADPALADACDAEASCESFEGDAPASCEELFARAP